MIGELLLHLMVRDLREFSDQEIRDYLELVAGLPPDEERPRQSELQEQALDQLEANVPDRETVATWPETFEELLPPAMQGYGSAVDEFEQLLERLFDEEDLEETERVERFRACLELLDEPGDWQERSEAARGMGTLEEELFQARDDYLKRPVALNECSPASVVAHQQLLDGFEIWQGAFRQAHGNELDEALESAVEGTYIFRAVECWSRKMAGPTEEGMALLPDNSAR